ncbi:NuA4-domain-containing protein [Meira miltonrushii]|uniref:Chromatin modification-related protein EAF6 n=1 Tax=Meira miltonrushii TaxID=1280837 RepID=A0A316VH27_9BASI|nr:NuA4-domain-containing protein [Meira miltonrushii]PWN36957.1 NuA4-domain-containing protein [Meira miltonrushii]
MPSVAQQESPLAGSLEEAKQRYETTKKALKTGISKKRQIDRALTDLESQIFLFEGSYLASTSASGGNIVKGFDGYLKSTATGGHTSKSAAAALAMNPNDVPIEDRMFSNSSSTYTRSLQLKANEGRSREQSPSLSKKGDKNEKTDKSEKEGKSEKSSKSEKGGKSEKGKKDKDDDRSELGTPSTSGKKDKHAVDSTPTKGKKRDREKEASAQVNGSSKKKQRKDDD